MRRILRLAVAMTTCAVAATSFPFPYRATYPYGTIPAPDSGDADRIRTGFATWMANDYVVCPDGTARILWTDPSRASATGTYTISRDIGSGMLVAVYRDDSLVNTRSIFDKLWAFYKKNRNGNGLMNWKITGCSEGLGPNGAGSATDADLDAALALAMAYKQWGVDQYRTDAIDLLWKIWISEINTTSNLPKASDAGSLPYAPGRFPTGAMRLFKQVDPSHDWGTVADACLTLLRKSQNASTGLVPDWVNDQGVSMDSNGSGTGKFGSEAVHATWRILLDYLWFGTANSKAVLSRIDTWIKGKAGNDVDAIASGYSTDGTTTASESTPVDLGALLMPGMTASSSNQIETAGGWLSSGWTRLDGLPSSDETSRTWKILYDLTLSGTFQNYWGTVNADIGGTTGTHSAARPDSWRVSRSGAEIVVRIGGRGSAELLDSRGRIRSSVRGEGTLRLRRPEERGVYFAVVRSEGIRGTLPVVVED